MTTFGEKTLLTLFIKDLISAKVDNTAATAYWVNFYSVFCLQEEVDVSTFPFRM